LACPGGTSAQCTPRTTSRLDVELLICAIRSGVADLGREHVEAVHLGEVAARVAAHDRGDLVRALDRQRPDLHRLPATEMNSLYVKILPAKRGNGNEYCLRTSRPSSSQSCLTSGKPENRMWVASLAKPRSCGGDEHDRAAALHERQVRREDLDGLLGGDVLDDVRGEQRVEPVRLGVLALVELLGGERGEPGRPARLDRRRVVVDADAVAVEVGQVASDAAADIQCEAEVQPPDVPPVRRLDVEQAFPAGTGLALQPLGVVDPAGRGAHITHGDTSLREVSLRRDRSAPRCDHVRC
jgi:hypothetical protein